ncbi:MAG: helix-turn-helix domain-containing protein [Bacteroidales bacterium]|nr:helix-turn-helix domain-containing protein [Bacteroidales bacterium]
MKIDKNLSDKLLLQQFIADDSDIQKVERCRMIAESYATVENSIAVLSDMKEDVSYIYYGGIADILGVGKKGACQTIPSIWEKEVLKFVYSSDMENKNIDELQFFHFMKSISRAERENYCLISCIKMNTSKGIVPINHRIFYIVEDNDESIRFALCLYNIVSVYDPESYIFNTLNGEKISLDQKKIIDLLSLREKEILKLIEKGKLSKEIAQNLSISINTVNRHRQNILAKLRVQNSIEACKIAGLLNMI